MHIDISSLHLNARQSPSRDHSQRTQHLPEWMVKVQILTESICMKYFPFWTVYIKHILNCCRKHFPTPPVFYCSACVKFTFLMNIISKEKQLHCVYDTPAYTCQCAQEAPPALEGHQAHRHSLGANDTHDGLGRIAVISPALATHFSLVTWYALSQNMKRNSTDSSDCKNSFWSYFVELYTNINTSKPHKK